MGKVPIAVKYNVVGFSLIIQIDIIRYNSPGPRVHNFCRQCILYINDNGIFRVAGNDL